jgi:hypothetical protein
MYRVRSSVILLLPLFTSINALEDEEEKISETKSLNQEKKHPSQVVQ